MSTITRLDPRGGILHSAVVHGDTIHFAGMVASDLTQDMHGQASDILQQLDAQLTAAGSDRSRVLSVTIYITDMALKPDMNRAWKAFFDAAHLPGRATIGVADLGPNVLIEMVATAAR
jgi:enamine deaminase RidA (YjgF/YER057c/UK114 family)